MEALRRARGVELPTLRARAEVSERRGSFTMELQISQHKRRARRRLSAPRCDELADAAAWLIVVGQEAGSFALGGRAEPQVPPAKDAPLAASDGAASTPAAAADAEAEPEPAPAPEASEADARPKLDAFASDSGAPRAERADGGGERARSPRGRWSRVAAWGGIFAGKLPAPQATVGASAGFGFGHLYAELRFVHAFERSQGFGSVGSERRASFYSDQLGALACGLFDFARERLRGGPCLHLFAARTWGAAEGTIDPESRAYYWVLAGPSAQLALLVVGPIELILEGGASLPLRSRPRFEVAGHGAVARAALLSPYASLALGARW